VNFPPLIQLWDVPGRKEVHTIGPFKEAVASFAFGAEGTLLALSANDGHLRLWEGDRQYLPHKTLPRGYPSAGAMTVQFTPEGRHVVTGNMNSTIYVFRLAPPAPPAPPAPNGKAGI
jgi:WD40 repeat protein